MANRRSSPAVTRAVHALLEMHVEELGNGIVAYTNRMSDTKLTNELHERFPTELFPKRVVARTRIGAWGKFSVKAVPRTADQIIADQQFIIDQQRETAIATAAVLESMSKRLDDLEEDRTAPDEVINSSDIPTNIEAKGLKDYSPKNTAGAS